MTLMSASDNPKPRPVSVPRVMARVVDTRRVANPRPITTAEAKMAIGTAQDTFGTRSWPAVGAATARKPPTPATVATRPIHSDCPSRRPPSRADTSSPTMMWATRMGSTNTRWPVLMAVAWNAKPLVAMPMPASHRFRRSRRSTSRGSMTVCGSSALAACCCNATPVPASPAAINAKITAPTTGILARLGHR